ncbi:MAG TPA: hypothetical protein VGP68_10575 [Gemmataceae bacterium]|nr:hypothetical protein [Gemmataceae bacterium]
MSLALWIGVPGILFLRSYKTRCPVVGLLLGYCMQLGLIHLTGGIIQLLPWYTSTTRADTLAGFPITGYVLIGLLAGHSLAQPGVLRRSRPGVRDQQPVLRSPETGWMCIGVGLVAYFGLMGSAFSFASLSSVVANGLNLAAIGFCFEWWFYYRSGQKQLAWHIAAGVLLLPVLTVLLMGFLGFGINAVLILCAFVAVSGVPRRTILIGGTLLAFGLISIWTVYMGVRSQIRDSVWGGEGLQQRAAVVSSNVQNNWGWFSLGNNSQLDQIDERLNQNSLLGAAVRELEAGHVKFAEGETLQNMLFALVPRMIWRDKPIYAGSGMLVTRFTGMEFGAGTSVGIGHVMEIYVNYGKTGVLIGFTIIGILLSVLDIAAAEYLYLGRLEEFLLCFVAGSTFLTVGGVLAESPPAFIGSMALTFLVSRVFLPTISSRPIRAPGCPKLRNHT